MCGIKELPEDREFNMRIEGSMFGFSVYPVKDGIVGGDIIKGDKHFLKREIKFLNAKNGCLGVCYDDYSVLEKVKAHLMCLWFSPKKYVKKLVERKKIQQRNFDFKQV